MNRKPKVTKTESKAAFNLQTPLDNPVARAKAKKAAANLPSVVDFNALKEARKAFRQYDDEPNWIPTENLVGQPFYIVDAFTFESEEFGSKCGFKIKFDPTDELVSMFSLSWNHERDETVKAIKALRKRNGKNTSVGLLTIVLIPSDNGMNPYKKIVAYTDEIAQEFATRAKGVRAQKTTKKSRKSVAKPTKRVATPVAVDDLL